MISLEVCLLLVLSLARPAAGSDGGHGGSVHIHVIDFESGKLTSGGLTFTRTAGTALQQPVKYSDASDTSNPAGGGNYLFRTDYNGASKVGDGPVVTFVSTGFRLGAGEVTFQYTGDGGYIAICKGTECKKKHPRRHSVSMIPGSFAASELSSWVGETVHFRLVDNNNCYWAFLAVDNIKFNMQPGSVVEHTEDALRQMFSDEIPGTYTKYGIIAEHLQGLTNVALMTHGASCTSIKSYDNACTGSIDGMYEEGQFVSGSDFRLHSRQAVEKFGFFLGGWEGKKLDKRAAAWIKVQLGKEYQLKYAGVMQRIAPCDRWKKIGLETPAGTENKQLGISQYTLFSFEVKTNWVKVTPKEKRGSHFNSGILEIEFWTASPSSPNCKWGPFLKSSDVTSGSCEAWNNWIMQQGYSIQMQSNTSGAFTDMSTLASLKPVTATMKTSPVPGVFVGFKLTKYPVRGTKDGDCRGPFQGNLLVDCSDKNMMKSLEARKANEDQECLKRNKVSIESVQYNVKVQRECIIAKWTSCTPTKCEVKKQCQVHDLHTVQNSLVQTCMKERCASTCALA